MTIALGKTLQTVAYTFHIVSELAYSNAGMVISQEAVYQSSGHFTDGFVPMIRRQEVITDASVITTVEANKYSDYAVAINTIEDWLVANVAWYATGTVS